MSAEGEEDLDGGETKIMESNGGMTLVCLKRLAQTAFCDKLVRMNGTFSQLASVSRTGVFVSQTGCCYVREKGMMV